MNYSTNASPAPVRLREFLWIALATGLFVAFLSKDSWKDDAVIEEAHMRIHQAQKTCQRALDSAERHAQILAKLMTEDSILTAPGVIVSCRRKFTRMDG